MSGLKINIDLHEVIEEFHLMEKTSMELANFVLKQTAQSAINTWKGLAKKELKSTREGYIKNLQIVEEGRLRDSIVLTGWLNNAMESGTERFDMKPGFMQSNKAKHTKEGGWYLRVPINKDTIRTASSKSKPSSWIHPGFEALGLAEKSIKEMNINVVVENAIDEFLNKNL